LSHYYENFGLSHYTCSAPTLILCNFLTFAVRTCPLSHKKDTALNPHPLPMPTTSHFEIG